MAEPVSDGIVRRIYGNFGKLVSGKAAAGLIGLLYMIVAARSLGPRDYGVLVLVHTFATTVGGIIEFPGWHAVVRYGARSRRHGDASGTMRLLRFVGMIELSAGLLAIVAAALLGRLLGARLGWSATALAFAIPYSLAVLGSVRSTPAGYLQLEGRFDLLGLHNIVAPLMRLLGSIVALASSAGLPGFLIAWLVAAILEFGSLWAMGLILARRHLPDAPFLGRTAGVLAENPGIRRFMIGANADVTLSELSGRIAPLIIGWLLGPAAVGLYAIAQRATVLIAQPAQILGQSAYAELARLAANRAEGLRIRRAVLHCTGIALAASIPVILILAIFSRQIAILIGGPAFAASGALMLWLVAARVIMLAAPASSSALIALGWPSLSVTANLATNILAIPVLPVLLLGYGLIGSGFHAIVQSAACSALLLWFVIRETGRTQPERGAVLGVPA